uniref:Ribonuclease H protein At1g65750 family n=1 Tax=Cajanus cajan TaxID=3821 RepID=A0A151SI97_CAJCA|nr:Putative ribonuclease H protein At1g65750 family [Cajanus cajan]
MGKIDFIYTYIYIYIYIYIYVCVCVCCDVSKGVPSARIEQLEQTLGIEHTPRFKRYLGIPMFHGKAKIADFHHVIDRINDRLATWKGRLLNKAGRLCLINSVVTSIPLYSMQSLWLPQAVCNRINQASRTMLWAKAGSSQYWSLVGWNTVTRPKEFGGLGIRESRQVNISLIGKLIWDLLHSPQKPWVKILQAKYLHGASVLQAKKGNGASQVWNSIVKASPICDKASFQSLV